MMVAALAVLTVLAARVVQIPTVLVVAAAVPKPSAAMVAALAVPTVLAARVAQIPSALAAVAILM